MEGVGALDLCGCSYSRNETVGLLRRKQKRKKKVDKHHNVPRFTEEEEKEAKKKNESDALHKKMNRHLH